MKRKRAVLAFLFQVGFMLAGMALFKVLHGGVTWNFILGVSIVVPVVSSIGRAALEWLSNKQGNDL